MPFFDRYYWGMKMPYDPAPGKPVNPAATRGRLPSGR